MKEEMCMYVGFWSDGNGCCCVVGHAEDEFKNCHVVAMQLQMSSVMKEEICMYAGLWHDDKCVCVLVTC